MPNKLSSLIRENLSAHHEDVSGVALSDIFAEEPVPLDVFVRDSRFLNHPNLGPLQYNDVRHIERVYYPNLYPLMAQEFDSLYWAEQIRMINLASVLVGKGGGKDAIARISSMRIAYLLLCLKSPQTYFGFGPSESIHMLNIASSSGQANDAYFAPMREALKKSPWFKDRCEVKRGEIEYDKHITAISGHSDAETQEGLSLILGVADEVDAFKSSSELAKHRGNAARESSRSSESILKMLEGSSSTRFPETYKVVRISYPRYKGSKIMQLVDEGRADQVLKGERSIHHVSGPHKTWDYNPRFDRYPRIKIPQSAEPIPDLKSYITLYEKDASSARGIYECKPDYATDPYFKNLPMIRQAMSEAPEMVDAIITDYSLGMVRSERTAKTTPVWSPIFVFHPDFKAIPGARYCIHADMALKGDRAGIAMSHVVRYEDVVLKTIDEDGFEDQMEYRKPVVKTDFAIHFAADLTVDPQREIQIRWARMLVFELIKRGFHVAQMSFDGWQSLDGLQILEANGVLTEKISVDRDDTAWKTLRDVIYEGRHTMPHNELLFVELAALSRLPSGKIDHPPDLSKDVADSVAGSVLAAITIGGVEETEEDALVQFSVSPQTQQTSGEGNFDFSFPAGGLDLPWGFDISYGYHPTDNY